jgi:hypothetical protein
MTYRLGRKPNDPSKPRIRLAAHLNVVNPPPPTVTWDAVPDWGMLGNDQYGDCVFAGNGHLAEALTFYGQGTETALSEADVLAEYSRVAGFNPADPSTDQGAAVQDGLSDLRTNGLAGVKLAAFAEVDVTSLTEIKSACAELGPLSAGVNLPATAQKQFEAGQAWDVVADDGGIEGGHCIVLVGYDADFLCFVTWGKVQRATYAWWAKYGAEVWAVISQDWVSPKGADPEGVNLASLGEEFATLTGEPSPFAAPAPSPSPGPATSPEGLLAEFATLVRTIAASADRDVAEAVAWLHSHGL